MPAKHLRLTVPVSFAGLGAIYYGISMLSLANGNMTTALAVAANIEFLPAIAAMSLRAVPTVALPVVIYVLYRLRHYRTDGEDLPVIVVLSAVAGLAAIFHSSIVTLAVCVILAVLHLIHLISFKRNWKRKFNRGRFDPELAGILMLSLISTSVIWGPSWVAKETAIIANEQHLVSVIKETDELIYFLDRKTNKVVYAKPSDLRERAFCGTGGFDTVNAIINFMTDGPTYPDCPRPKSL